MGRVATNRGLRVVAIDPTRNGFAYAVLEGKECLIDYGLVGLPKDGSKTFSEMVAEVLERFEPEVVVLESPVKTRRRRRAKRRIKEAEAEALRHGIPFCAATREQVREALGWKGTTKYHLARAATRHFPELLRRLPPERKFYEPERERMNIFDAVSFALTFFYEIERPATE